MKPSRRASAQPRKLQAGPQGSVRLPSPSSSPPNIETAWSSLGRAKASLREECKRRSRVAGAEMNGNCKACLEKSSRCPHLLSLVLAPCPGSEEISRACCRIGRPLTPLSPHMPFPCQEQPSLPPLVHSSSTHGCGLPLQTGSHLLFPPYCIETQEASTSTLPTPSSSLTLVGKVDTHCPPSPALAVGSCPPAPGSRCLRMGSLSTPTTHSTG